MRPLARAAYVVAGPLIPFVRAARTLRSARTAELRGYFIRCLPAMLVALSVDALGQMVGYALGAGNAGGKLSRYECHRIRHVTARDRQEVFAE